MYEPDSELYNGGRMANKLLRKFSLSDLQDNISVLDQFKMEVNKQFSNTFFPEVSHAEDKLYYVDEAIKEIHSVSIKNTSKLDNVNKICFFNFYISTYLSKDRYIYLTQAGNYRLRPFLVSYMSNTIFFRLPTLLINLGSDVSIPKSVESVDEFNVPVDDVHLSGFYPLFSCNPVDMRNNMLIIPLIPEKFFSPDNFSTIPDFNTMCKVVE